VATTKEREDGGSLQGPPGACGVHAASHGASYADSGQAAAPADKDGVGLQAS